MAAGSLWFDSNTIPSEPFVFFIRFYLGLLPLLKPLSASRNIGGLLGPTRESICSSGHVDPAPLLTDTSKFSNYHGSHDAHHTAHERINETYAAFYRESGGIVDVNPSTATMMQRSLSDQAARICMLYPKVTTPAAKEQAHELQVAFLITATKQGDERVRLSVRSPRWSSSTRR